MKRMSVVVLSLLWACTCWADAIVSDDFSDQDYTNNPTWVVDQGLFTCDGTQVDGNVIGNSRIPDSTGMLAFGTTAGTRIHLDFADVTGETVLVRFDLRQSNGTTGSYPVRVMFGDAASGNMYLVDLSPNPANFSGSGVRFYTTTGFVPGLAGASLSNGSQWDRITLTFNATEGCNAYINGQLVASWENFYSLSSINQLVLQNLQGVVSWFADDVVIQTVQETTPLPIWDNFSDQDYTNDATWVVDQGLLTCDGTQVDGNVIGNSRIPDSTGMLAFGTTAGTQIHLDFDSVTDETVSVSFSLRQSNGTTGSYPFKVMFGDTFSGNMYTVDLSPNPANFSGSGVRYYTSTGTTVPGLAGASLSNGSQWDRITFTFNATEGCNAYINCQLVASWENFHSLSSINQLVLQNLQGVVSWFVDDVSIQTIQPAPAIPAWDDFSDLDYQNDPCWVVDSGLLTCDGTQVDGNYVGSGRVPDSSGMLAFGTTAGTQIHLDFEPSTTLSFSFDLKQANGATGNFYFGVKLCDVATTGEVYSMVFSPNAVSFGSTSGVCTYNSIGAMVLGLPGAALGTGDSYADRITLTFDPDDGCMLYLNDELVASWTNFYGMASVDRISLQNITGTLSWFVDNVELQTNSDVAAPVFSPSGTYITGSTAITMTSETVGATIYYTTDGTNPTAASTEYTGSVTVDDGMTLKAIAIANDVASKVTRVTYEVPEEGYNVIGSVSFNSGYILQDGLYVGKKYSYSSDENMSCGVVKLPLNDYSATIDSAMLYAGVTANTLGSEAANYFVVEHYTYENNNTLQPIDASTTSVERISGVESVTSASVCFAWDVKSQLLHDIAEGWSHSAFRIVMTDASGNYLTTTSSGSKSIVFSNNVSLVVSENDVTAEISRGHRILVHRGLQVQAQRFPLVTGSLILNWDTWDASNFSTMNSHWYPGSSFLGDAIWGRYAGVHPLSLTELPYLSNLVSIQYRDEQDLSDLTKLAETTSQIALWKSQVPTALVYTNQWGSQLTEVQLQSYMQIANPDMVMFDSYPFTGSLTGASPTVYYEHMQKYRLLGLDGNDGTQNTPIPYALYLHTFTKGTDYTHVPSDSEMRLNQFTAWAFGYKFVSAFVYESPNTSDIYSTLFNGLGDTSPTAQFTQIAETNRQSRNLGPALVRLLSTDLRMIMGKHGSSGVTNSSPDNITIGVSGADDYMIGAEVTAHPSNVNDNQPGDIIVGFFKVLHESFDGGYSNQKYFMVVNGLSDATATAGETQQTIKLTFNMGSSGISSLKRLNRDTGEVETVALTSTGGSTYELYLTLDGGTGDLFMYNTGAPFVGIEEANPIPGDANMDGSVDVGDLGILAANYGRDMQSEGVGENLWWGLGDFTGDGAVDVGDLGVLAANYGTNSSSADWSTDYAEVFGSEESAGDEESDSILCSSLGLPLVAGLALIGLMLVKLEE